LKNERQRLAVLAAFAETGTYRGAAVVCGTTHKTVRRIVEAQQSAARGEVVPEAAGRARNYDDVAELMKHKISRAHGKISAKRLLPLARSVGYTGSDRNFRRLISRLKAQWRAEQERSSGRRPAVWEPGDVLAIDFGGIEKLAGRTVKVFSASLCWSRFRFVRFAPDETQETTLRLLAECFEALGGVPATVLADRMACLRGQTVANVVVPTADYVRFAAHYGFRPDFCEARDPQSKGIVENLVGYAQSDLLAPLRLEDDPWAGGWTHLNDLAAAWCDEVNARVHSEIAAIPRERHEGTGGAPGERALLRALPQMRPHVGPAPITRKVDKLSCIRFASARYSVPNALIGTVVTVLVDEMDKTLRVITPITGEILAEHELVAPGEVAIDDAHYGGARPDKPARAARARTKTEADFLALGPAAEAFLKGAAAAAVTRLPAELDQITGLIAAHGQHAVIAALERAVTFKRWRADDIRSILATNGAAPHPTPAGQALVMTLPHVPSRSLDAYKITHEEAS